MAAKLTVEKFGKTHNVVIINTPISEEDEDNTRFLKDVEQWIGQKIVYARNKDRNTDSAQDVWEERKYMSGVRGAPCTKILKKEARYQFQKKVKIDWHVLGFTFEEIDRHKMFIENEQYNTLPILISHGITKPMCYNIISDAGILLPISYRQGYTNANCKGCVKATSPEYWNLVRRTDPDVFKARAEQSRRLGVKLVRYQGKRIFLDELPEDAKGYKIKSYECGLFCTNEKELNRKIKK